jgi:RND superfamily putative drug exporter
MLVVPTHSLGSPANTVLYRQLRREADSIDQLTNTTIGITGGGAQLVDYNKATSGRFPFAALAIILVTFIILVFMLRSLLLPAIAVVLNIGTVAVAYGVLTILVNLPAGFPLGGHGSLDVTSITGVFTIAFGLSIDYAVFLLMRMRESYDQNGDHAAAVMVGLEKTARVITGAAAIMAAVFIAFATAPIATLGELGVGLTVAVLIDATIIRIILLPALMLILGDRVWWLPPSLARILPRLEWHT